MKKKFILFAFWSYEAEGGWKDFKGFFDTLDEALDGFAKYQDGQGGGDYNIVDTETWEIVKTRYPEGA